MELFDYDPLTGVTDYFDYDPVSDQITIYQEQDVEPLLKFLHEQRVTGDADQGIKHNFAKYASLPMTVILELKKKGVDVFDPNCTKRLLEEIEMHYPLLKATEKKHAVRM